MTDSKRDEDVRAIEAVIERQLSCMNWDDGAGGNWPVFRADFLDQATLFPAARPLEPQTVEDFVARMDALAGSSLPIFHQRPTGTLVQVFGQVAIAMAGVENREGGPGTVRGVEAYLLVKCDGEWRIAAQSWDVEGPDQRVPEVLRGD